jgi:hypothetical protein
MSAALLVGQKADDRASPRMSDRWRRFPHLTADAVDRAGDRIVYSGIAG